MTLTIQVSDELFKRAGEIAATEKMSVEELFAASVEQRIVQFEWLKEKAAKGSLEKFQRVMAKVQSREPDEHDRL